MLVEAKITPSVANSASMNIADVHVEYFDVGENIAKAYTNTVVTQMTNDVNLMRNTRDKDVIIAATEQKAAVIHAQIIKLRDQGKVQQAKEKLKELSFEVNKAAEDLNSDRLGRYGKILKDQLTNIANDLNWNKTRKTGKGTLHSVSFGTI